MSNLDTLDTGVVRILHVDDDETFLILAKEILQAENKFEIETVSSAVEAIKKFESEEYDVIVSDYEMPHEDGLQFLKKLREQKNQTPFILFTGKGREEVAIKALNLGADYYLNKHGSTEVVFGELAHAIMSSARSKYAELKIKESQEIYRASFEGAMDAIMLLDEKGFLDCNKTTLSLFGFTTVNDFANRHPADLSPLNQPDGSSSRTKAMDHIIKAFETGMNRFFWIHKRLDNSTFLADVLLMRLQIQGRYVLQATVRDVTKQKDFEAALIESETRLKAYLNSIATGIFVIDSESHIILEANEAAKKMFGDSKTPIVGSLCYNFTCANKKCACPITDLGQTVDHSERTLLKANGEHLPILKTVAPITLNGRKLLIESFVDITKLKEAEKRLSFSERKYRDLINSMNDTVWVIDLDAKFVDVNETAVKKLGYTREELLSMGPADIDTNLNAEEIKSLLRKMPIEGMQVFETTHTTKDRKKIPVEISSSLVMYKGKQAVLSIARDITQRKKFEGEREDNVLKLSVMNDKLRVIGGLTRHDVGNKLAVIGANSFLLKKNSGDNPVIAKYLEVIDSAISSSKSLLEFSNYYSKIGVEKLAAFNVEKCFNDILSLFSELKKVEILNECKGLNVIADSLLTRVFYNLVDNSIKYGEKITQIRVYYESQTTEIKLVYEDNGVGVPDENKSKLFNEGFSTAKSTGLGLFLIRKIIEFYGWTITEDGESGKGAKFIIRIPKNIINIETV